MSVAVSTMATAVPVTRRQRLGKKEKLHFRQQQQQSIQSTTDAAAPPAASAWSYYPLADSPTRTPPVLFNPSSTYAFVATGCSIKIYSVATCTLLSTLSPPAVTGEGKISRPRVSVLLLNPANPLQLIVGSLDGMLRIWDYVEGRLLRTLEVGGAVLYACGHESLGDQLFVALAAEDDAVSKKARQDDKKAAPMAGIYSISLKPRSVPGSPSSLSPSHPRSPARRMRLAHPRPLTSLSLSPSGSYLISVNPNTINLCRTSHLSRGFARHVETKEAMTTLAFHPTEDYFATGEVGGRIRLWYGILSSSEEWEVSSKTPSTTRTAELTTSVFHWHTTPVSSLVFTPNGGYLLSAGGESVIVLWQLHTGHQEYVPRLGGAVETLSITEDPGVEQVVAARMADGSVVFVGMGKLKVLRSIKGLKTDPVPLSPLKSSLIPLTLQPLTNSLVLPSSHPSSLQFYSATTDSQTHELEISPSNRVSTVHGEESIEPTRVERVSFSKPERDGGYWMATLDGWGKGRFATVRHLKFWRYHPASASFTLVTRIERPHEGAITSLSFSPVAPLLLTTSTDGTSKLWSLTSSWSCLSSHSYRSLSPTASAWSPDGSLYLVAYPSSITLWNTTGGMIHSFSCAGLGNVGDVGFGGEEGGEVWAMGSKGGRGWSLLGFEEIYSLPISLSTLTPKPHSNLFIGTTPTSSSSRSSTALVIDTSKQSVEAVSVPFGIRQSVFLPASASTSTSSSPSEISLVVLNDMGNILMVGSSLSLTPDSAPAVRLDTAKGGSRLFDEIFGSESAPSRKIKVVKEVEGKGKGREGVLDMPAHTLPPARLLWKSMYAAFSTSPSAVVVPAEVKEGREENEMEVEVEESLGGVVYSREGVDLAEAFRKGLSLA